MGVRLPVQNAERPSDSSFHRPDDRDEMWEGVCVKAPLADMEHQGILTEFSAFLTFVLTWRDLGVVYPGCNVSDRDEGWTENYRIPDVAVFLPDGVGLRRHAHSLGGPDFLIEVLSDNDPAPRKLPFYGKNGVREVLFIKRDPWAVELYRNLNGVLTLVETSTPENEAIVSCSVVPMAVRLIRVAEGSRPNIEISQIGGDLRTLF